LRAGQIGQIGEEGVKKEMIEKGISEDAIVKCSRYLF
jgi:hypothetical protein